MQGQGRVKILFSHKIGQGGGMRTTPFKLHGQSEHNSDPCTDPACTQRHTSFSCAR